MKHNFFKFYVSFYDLIDAVSIFQVKKLLLALCEYADQGFTTVKMSKKTKVAYETITKVFEIERKHYQKLGQKGLKKRWNSGTKKGRE